MPSHSRSKYAAESDLVFLAIDSNRGEENADLGALRFQSMDSDQRTLEFEQRGVARAVYDCSSAPRRAGAKVVIFDPPGPDVGHADEDAFSHPDRYKYRVVT